MRRFGRRVKVRGVKAKSSAQGIGKNNDISGGKERKVHPRDYEVLTARTRIKGRKSTIDEAIKMSREVSKRIMHRRMSVCMGIRLCWLLRSTIGQSVVGRLRGGRGKLRRW